MNAKYSRYLFVIFLAGSMSWTSCSIMHPYQAPETDHVRYFRDIDNQDTQSLAVLKWEELFTDTLLQRLIAKGIDHNPDMLAALARIRQAQAYYQQSKAALFPSLDANAGVSIAKLSEAQGFGIRTSATQYQLGVSTAWEADIWGKLRSAKRAGLAALLQTKAGARAVQTDLVAQIANYYYTLLALDQQLLITMETVNNWDSTVITMRALKEAAVVTEAAVVQSEAQRYAAEVTIPDLKQAILETENALSILVGREPANVPRSQLELQRPLTYLHTGVPAQLLANRPDVQQAEQNFRYYFEMTNAARAYFYPTLSITGSAGLNSLSFEDLFKPASIVASLGAGVLQPVFNRRLNKTRLEVAKAQQEEAYYGFQNALLNAGREVSNALSLHTRILEKKQIRKRQIEALEYSVSYTQELLQHGFANYNEIITARQSLLQAQLGDVNDKLQQLQSIVNLYRALGGGWR